LAAEELGTCEEIRRIGGDSGWLRSIPWTGKKRAALRSFSACRPDWGRHGTATLGGSHGGSSSCTGSEHDVRERETEGEEGKAPGREEKEEGEGMALLEVSRESSSVSRQAGGGDASARELHAAASLCWR
jgi:hypothetical protein